MIMMKAAPFPVDSAIHASMQMALTVLYSHKSAERSRISERSLASFTWLYSPGYGIKSPRISMSIIVAGFAMNEDNF
jgi:hypothetical protein